jgi:HPt (histidine-containing phosphotransfer) domain-containing protein
MRVSTVDDANLAAGLAGVAGLDHENAVRRFAGDRPLYVQQLALFFTRHGATLDVVGAALRAGDVVLAASEVHRVVGASAVLGVQPVHMAAKALEAALVAKEPAQDFLAMLEQVIHEFAAMRAQLLQRLGD